MYKQRGRVGVTEREREREESQSYTCVDVCKGRHTDPLRHPNEQAMPTEGI